VLSEADVASIQSGVLQVLERTGVNFHDEKALKLLADAGCRVEFDSHRVRFPNELVRDCLSRCPSSYEVKARNPDNSWLLGEPSTTYFVPANGSNTVDLDSWQPRQPTRKEFHDLVKLMDALPSVHGLPAFPWYGFEKVPQAMRLLESAAAKIRMTTKPIMEGSVLESYRWSIQMARVTGQDILQLVNPVAPLTVGEEEVAKTLYFTQEDMPFHVTSGPVAGATAPATLAGAVISSSAENIAGIVLAQLVKPGARVWSGNMTLVQNMRNGSPMFGQVANSLLDAAYQQLWREYQVPSWSIAAAWSDSKQIDYQAGYETTMAATTSALAGASMVRFQGGISQQLSMHPAKLVLDADAAGMIGRFLQGVEVSDETMALDLIDQVGPIPGNFLATSHTRSWWRQEQYMPRSADHGSYADFFREGSPTVIRRAMERMEEILASHKPTPLPTDQEEAIEDILNDARRYYRSKGHISESDWSLYQEDLASSNYPYA